MINRRLLAPVTLTGSLLIALSSALASAAEAAREDTSVVVQLDRGPGVGSAGTVGVSGCGRSAPPGQRLARPGTRDARPNLFPGFSAADRRGLDIWSYRGTSPWSIFNDEGPKLRKPQSQIMGSGGRR